MVKPQENDLQLRWLSISVLVFGRAIKTGWMEHRSFALVDCVGHIASVLSTVFGLISPCCSHSMWDAASNISVAWS